MQLKKSKQCRCSVISGKYIAILHSWLLWIQKQLKLLLRDFVQKMTDYQKQLESLKAPSSIEVSFFGKNMLKTHIST